MQGGAVSSAELFEHARCLGRGDLAAYVHVLRERWLGVPELVGDGTRRQPGGIEERGRGLAEDVTGDPGKPAPLQAVFQIGLGVRRVAALPRDWTTIAERYVLHILACDSYDGRTSRPGLENLAAWTGMHRSSVAEVVNRLLRPSDHRPALLARTS